MQLTKSKVLVLLVLAVAAMGHIWYTTQNDPSRDSTGASSRSDSAVKHSNTPKMVELYAPYCSSCMEMKPLISRLSHQCDTVGINIETYDISKSENEHFVDDYDIGAVPTFLFIDENGIESARLVGKQTESTLKQALSVLSGKSCPGMTPIPGRTRG